MKPAKLLCIVLLIVTLGLSVASGAGRMSIQVKKGYLRSSPSFLGKIVTALAYGDRVDSLDTKNSWSYVGIPGTGHRGWIHATALTTKKIVFSAGDQNVDTAATSDEIALAGKGFNKSVENEFKQKNRHIDYQWIDKMERFTATPNQIRRFVQNGDLVPAGGAK